MIKLAVTATRRRPLLLQVILLPLTSPIILGSAELAVARQVKPVVRVAHARVTCVRLATLGQEKKILKV